MTTSSLTGAGVIVTGAGRGIGRVIAEHFAAAGARVVLTARSGNDLEQVAGGITAAGGQAVVHVADVTSEADVDGLIAHAVDELGHLDVVVNNAGGQAAIGPVWELPVAAWWGDIELNLKSAYLVMRATLPSMIERGAGRIINLSSLLGTGPGAYTCAYGSAKAALLMLTESTELALAGTGVHVFSMSPGLVVTPGFESTTLGPLGRKWMPTFSALPEGATVGPELAAKGALRIAAGDADALAGRFLHVCRDLDQLVADVASIEADERLVLRMQM